MLSSSSPPAPAASPPSADAPSIPAVTLPPGILPINLLNKLPLAFCAAGFPAAVKNPAPGKLLKAKPPGFKPKPPPKP